MTQKNEVLVPQMNISEAAPESEVEIDLIELLYRMIEKAKYIIAAAVLGGVLAGLYTYFLVQPKYTATSKLYVLNPKDSAINLSDLQIGNYLASDYKEVFSNRHVHQRVIENLQLDYTYKDLQNMISVTNPSDTRILYVNVTATSPSVAQQLANEYATVAREFIAATMDTLQPNVFEEAWLPTAPSSPSLVRNVILGILLGGLISVVIVVVQFLQDDKLRTADDIQKYINLPTLGMMPLRGGQESRSRSRSDSSRKKQS